MEIQEIIDAKKELYSALLDFIEMEESYDSQLKNFIDIFEKQEIIKSQNKLLDLFKLIFNITCEHHKTPTFFSNLQKIFNFLINDKKSNISNSEL